MRGALCVCAREHRFDGLYSPEQSACEAEWQARYRKGQREEYQVTECHVHCPLAFCTKFLGRSGCIDNLPRRLSRAAPCGDRWIREVSPCQSSRVARMTPSPQWGNSERIGGVCDEPADGCRGFLIGVGVQTNGAHVHTKPLVLFPITGFSDGRPQLPCSGAERRTPHCRFVHSFSPAVRSTFLVCDRISISVQPCTDKQFAPAAAPCL
jgi:hypothetical protein